jgi:hypothetical protein
MFSLASCKLQEYLCNMLQGQDNVIGVENARALRESFLELKGG